MKVYYHGMYVPVDQLVPLAKRAEELGYDGFSLSDHLFFPRDSPGYQRRVVEYWDTQGEFPKGVGAYRPNEEFPDAWVAYAAMAVATERLEFGSSIYILPLRHPLVVAAAVASAYVFTGPRMWLGVGPGWLEEEYRAAGQPWEKRGRRMAEQIELMRKLWTGECVEHHGEFYDVEGYLHQPALDPPPRILLGGRTKYGLERIARYADGYIGGRPTYEDFVEIKEVIEARRRELGRDGEPFTWMTPMRHSDAHDPDVIKRYAEAGCDILRVGPFDIYGVPWGKDGTLQQRLDALERWAEYLDVAHNA